MVKLQLWLRKEEGEEVIIARLERESIELPEGISWYSGLCVDFGLEEWLTVDNVIVSSRGDASVWFRKECYPENSLSDEVKIFKSAGWNEAEQ